MGASFALVPPPKPPEILLPVAQRDAMSHAMREAIKAALAGDFKALDRLEVEYLNVLVRVGELVVRFPDGAPHWWFNPDDSRFRRIDHERYAPFVIDVLRGYGPRAETALEWSLGEKCRQCAGRLRHEPCRVCDGRWHLTDVLDEWVYTDLNGVILGA